jgi:hypothetical protein
MVIDDDCLESRRKKRIFTNNQQDIQTHTNSGVLDCKVTRIGLEEEDECIK